MMNAYCGLFAPFSSFQKKLNFLLIKLRLEKSLGKHKCIKEANKPRGKRKTKFASSTETDFILLFIFTSHGGGALLYEGTILNVMDPRASRCKMIINREFEISIFLQFITQQLL